MTVPRHEADAVRLQRFLLGRLPASQASFLIHQNLPPIRTITRSGASLVEDALRKGVVLFLVRAGGWRREGQPLWPWQRSPQEWNFSALPLRFLLWLTATRPSEARELWAGSPATAADQVAFLLAAQALQAFPEEWRTLRGTQPFAENPLVWLSLPMDGEPPSFAPLMREPLVLECLQPWLADRWAAMDRAANREADATAMQERGTQVRRTLTAFLSQAEAEGRHDLGRFLLQAIGTRLAEAPHLTDWATRLPSDATVKLSDRLAARRAVLSMIDMIDPLSRWDREARRLAFFDDGYAAGERWKAAYEAANGNDAVLAWRRLRQGLEPL